jgi:hypothetical protein
MNIYKELQAEFPDFQIPPNKGGNLIPWASQGVLLLNTCLTVRAHEAASHQKKGWENFTQKVIDTVARTRKTGVVFLCWGSPAQSRAAKIDKAKHHVLKAVHPSPLSAARGWFGCGHFKMANEWLRKRYGPEGEIDWNLMSKKPVAKILAKDPLPPVMAKRPVTPKSTAVPQPAIALKNVIPEKATKTVSSGEDEFDEGFDEDALGIMNTMSDNLAPSSPPKPSQIEEVEATLDQVIMEVKEMKETLQADITSTAEELALPAKDETSEKV